MARQQSRFLPACQDAAGGMKRCADDVSQIFSPQRELDRPAIGRVVSGLACEPQYRMGDAPLCALRGEFAHPVLHLLQALADDTDDVDRDLRVTVDQVEQLVLAPARFQGVGERDCVGRIASVREERDRPEHLAGANETDHDLGAVAARLGDTDAAFDDGVGANAVIALVEDAHILGQAAHARAGRRQFQGVGRQSAKKLHRSQ